MACGKNAYVVSQVDLAAAQERRPIGERRTRFVSCIVRDLPAGLSRAEIAFGNKQGFRVVEGESYEFDPEEEGIFFSWAPNLPGGVATFVLGVSDDGGEGMVRTA